MEGKTLFPVSDNMEEEKSTQEAHLFSLVAALLEICHFVCYRKNLHHATPN